MDKKIDNLIDTKIDNCILLKLFKHLNHLKHTFWEDNWLKLYVCVLKFKIVVDYENIGGWVLEFNLSGISK